MRSHRFHVALAATLGAVALVAGAVRAATAAPAWSRISGPTQPGSQLGLARTADGVLHVIWNRGTRRRRSPRHGCHQPGRRSALRRSRPAGTGTAGWRSSSCPTSRSDCLPPANGRHQHLHGACDRRKLDPPERSWLGWSDRRVRICDRRDADEGRPAGHRLAGQRRRRRPAGLHSAVGLPGRNGRVVPRDRCGQRRGRPRRRHECRAGRRLRPEDPAQPGPARRPASAREGMGQRAQRPHRRSGRLRRLCRRQERASLPLRRRVEDNRVRLLLERDGLRSAGRDGCGSPGATRAAASSPHARTTRRARSNRCRS